MKISRLHDERAQGVVEFAFIVSVLTLLFVGVVDYSRFLYYNTAIQSAARVAAEDAGNHCINATNCADPNTASTTATTDTYVLWDAYCEAQPYVSLTPAFTSCDNNGSSSSWTPTMSGSGSNCANDVCVYPACASTLSCSRSSGTQVTVSVGYKFHPIAFLLDWAFQEKSCWTASGGASQDVSVASNHHTLCATAVGRVS
jgi:Flp pilus assembly protein TadG